MKNLKGQCQDPLSDLTQDEGYFDNCDKICTIVMNVVENIVGQVLPVIFKSNLL